MSTPIIEAINNVNQTSLETVFAAVAADPTARDNLSQSDRNIDAVSTNVSAIEGLNNNEDAILRLLCRREGRDPANFADLNAVAADQGLMQSIAARQESSKILARSQKASAAAVVSQTAMQEVISSPTAIEEVRQSPTADSLFHLSNLYASTVDTFASINTGVTGGIDEIAASQAAMQEVINSPTAMQDVAASQTAMQEVAASQTAMQEVAASSTAIQEVAASSIAMQEVAASSTAMAEIDQVDFAVRSIMCGTTSLDPTSFTDANAIAQDSSAMSQIAANGVTMAAVAASQTAMQKVADSQTALDEIGNNATVENTVYNNNTAISALNSSNLKSSLSDTFIEIQTSTLKNDRVILLSQQPGNRGSRANQPVFTNSSNDLPHTADEIHRNNNRPSGSNRSTTHNATFIDIADS